MKSVCYSILFTLSLLVCAAARSFAQVEGFTGRVDLDLLPILSRVLALESAKESLESRIDDLLEEVPPEDPCDESLAEELRLSVAAQHKDLLRMTLRKFKVVV